jgi:indole-3-glycerol phosphate synthase
MNDVLSRIIAYKRRALAVWMRETSFEALLDAVDNAPPPLGFAQALDRTWAESERWPLIAEIKKASPSKGLIRNDFDPETLAAAYREGGATCLSVLTDTPYFQGCNADLIAAKSAGLPVLRKDFMVDPWQIAESRAIGADCVLLILAALSDSQAEEMIAAASDFGMDILVETHDTNELYRAIKLDCKIIGVNNRSLKTLEVSLDTGKALLPGIPSSRLPVAESGLSEPADLAAMAAAGARAFLIGESLMRCPDLVGATRNLVFSRS